MSTQPDTIREAFWQWMIFCDMHVKNAYWSDEQEAMFKAWQAATEHATAAQWMQIETAPKDGQCLLWVETDDGGEIMKLLRDKEGNWLYEGEPTYCASFYIQPTHWQPLPQPPPIRKGEALEGGQ